MVMRMILAVFGLAVAPAAIAEPVTLREMIEVTDLSSIAISPDGRHVVYRAEMASVERNAYDLSWYLVEADGRTMPRRVAGAGEGNWPDGQILAQPPLWSADGRWFYYRALIDGQVQVWRTSNDGVATEQVTHGDANVRGLALLPGDGGLVYTVGATRAAIARAEQDEYDRGVLIDAHVDPARNLFRASRIDGRLASERLTGFWFSHAGLLADRPLRYRTVDPRTGDTRDATAAEQALINHPGTPFDRVDGQRVLATAVSGDRRGTALVLSRGLHGALAVTRSGRVADAISCTKPACRERTIIQVAWQPGADRVAFTTTDGSSNHTLHLWDVTTGRVRSVGGGEGTLDGGRDGTQGCAIGGRIAVCVAAAANAPPHLVRIDLGGGATRMLADPNAALRARDTARFRPLTWTDASGKRFTGQLLLPASGTRPVPLFITYYVCDGYLRGGTGDEFPLRQFAAQGIAALCINRPPAAPELTDQRAHYQDGISGITAVVDLLRRQGTIDPRRVGMGGLSFGSEITMWVAMRSDLLAAASIATSLLTPTYYWFSALPGRDAPALMKQVWGFSDPDMDDGRWRDLSPAFNIVSIHAPLLMQVAEQEYLSNVEVVARLGRTETPVELWAFPGETHIKYQPRHRLAANERNLDWFRYWLQGYADPAPFKVEQYRRWRAFARKPGWHDVATVPAQASSHDRSQSSTSTSASTR